EFDRRNGVARGDGLRREARQYRRQVPNDEGNGRGTSAAGSGILNRDRHRSRRGNVGGGNIDDDGAGADAHDRQQRTVPQYLRTGSKLRSGESQLESRRTDDG